MWKSRWLPLMFSILLVTMFFPCAKANVSVSNEFLQPLGTYKSWSFEEGGYWSTNNGGYITSYRYIKHGHSWLTSGGGQDYYMWRDVEDSCINAIRGKTVRFGFWFYPIDLASKARGEIYYEYTSSGGRGCPYLNVWNGRTYATDNNLLPASEASVGKDVMDYYKLEQPLTSKNGTYLLQLSEWEEEHDFFDQAQLLAVDHPSNVSVAVTREGEILTYKNPSAPRSAVDNEGQNVKQLVNSADGHYYEGYNGSYITLNFGNLDIHNNSAKLVLRTDIIVKRSIHVQLRDDHEWKEVGSFIPRHYWSTDIIDISKFLDDMGSAKMRLVFTANHKVDYVGLDTSPQAELTIKEGQLSSAVHSKKGEVKSKLLGADEDYAQLLPGEQINMMFTLPKNTDEERDFVFLGRGRYETLPKGTVIDPTVYGSWFSPEEINWTYAYVKAYLPSTTYKVTVKIHGQHDSNFYAYIDCASLSIHDYDKTTDDRGDLALSADIYYIAQGATYDGRVFMAVALDAEGKGGYEDYYLMGMEIKVELLPIVNGKSTQKGQLSIEYVEQSDDKGYDIEPVENEQLHNSGVSTAITAVGTVTSAVVGYYYPDDYIYGPVYPEDGFVKQGEGDYELSWIFDTGSSSNFQIRVTATADWGDWYFDPTYMFAAQLNPAGSTTTSTVITINP